MSDLIFVVVTASFFLLSYWYVRFCEEL